jgi:hypothetical protein
MKLFNHILLPVRLKKDIEAIIIEGIELALHFECNVHFLLAIPSSTLMGLGQAGDSTDMAKSEESLKQKILSVLVMYPQFPDIAQKLHVSADKGNLETCISRHTLRNRIDLVVLRKSQRLWSNNWFMYLSVERLSKKINCPVLTLQSRLNPENVRNIVMPVGSFLPVRKLAFATYFARKYNSCLHLVALSNYHQSDDKDENMYLLKAYQLIRENTEVPVEYKTLNGANIAATTLQYAKKIKAGMIVINPGKESLLTGFINRVFSRFFFNESRIPVMTIAPASRN